MKRIIQMVSFGILSFLMSNITVAVAQKTYFQNPNRNFFEDHWQPKVINEISEFVEKIVATDQSDVIITIYLNDSINKILPTNVQIEAIKTMLGNVTETYTSKSRDFFPVAMTEYNCRGMQTATMLNSLFTAELIGEFVKNKYSMATPWVGEWKGTTTDTKGTITVNDEDQDPYTSRSPFMVYHFYHKWFGDYLIKARSSATGIKTYASCFSDGKIGVVIINQTAESKNVNINIDKFDEKKLHSVYYYSLYADNLNVGNKKFYINGNTSLTAGGGPENFDEIAPYKTLIANDGLINVP